MLLYTVTNKHCGADSFDLKKLSERNVKKFFRNIKRRVKDRVDNKYKNDQFYPDEVIVSRIGCINT